MTGMHTKVISSHDDAVLELQRYDRCPCDDGALCVLIRSVGLHVGAVVGAVDVISGLSNNKKDIVSFSTLYYVLRSGLRSPVSSPSLFISTAERYRRGYNGG